MFRRLLERLRAVRWDREAALLALFLAVALALQWAGGAWRSEFGGHPDEAAHVVTGLMVRDYLAQGLGAHPMQFAKDYYAHYPKVALGNWPPGFYVIQSAWTLALPPSRGPLLVLMALLAALTARILAAALEPEFGAVKSALAGLLFLTIPIVQAQTGMIMNEIPVTLFTLLAALAFGRFLEKEQARDAVAFGFLASAAILTKGSGLALALVPPLGVAFSRKWHLLRKPAFWYPAAIVLVVCGPWTFATLGMAKAGWEEGRPSLGFTLRALPFYARTAWLSAGAALTVLAAIGLATRLSFHRGAPRPAGLWSALGALFFGVWLFQSLVPCGLEERHFVPALVALAAFVIAGTEWIASQARVKRPAPLPWLIYGGAVVFFALAAFHIPRKDYRGFGPVAQELLQTAGHEDVFFISSDAIGEGMLVSEVALRERRPGHVVVRSSKLLASSTWGGRDYRAKAGDAAEVLAALQKAAVRYVVVDRTLPPQRTLPHHELLRRTLAEMPERFQPVGKFPAVRKGQDFAEGIEIWMLR